MNRMAWLLVLLATPAIAKKPAPSPPEPDLAVRWVRNADEWVAAVRQTYASALDEILHDATRLPAGTPWVVVSDLDETLLDNSAYQVEITGVGHSEERWRAWEARGLAVPMPGAVDFVAAVHAAGGQLAYVTNRYDAEATRAVLVQHGLWEVDDRLCVQTTTRDKAPRRASVREGTALCGWEGTPQVVVAYLGDQVSDFPVEGEEAPAAGLAWGDRWFMLPNPMYGSWSTRGPR